MSAVDHINDDVIEFDNLSSKFTKLTSEDRG